jgi:arylsulfatase A-like enzyme
LLTGHYAHNHRVYDNTLGGTPGGWPSFERHEKRTLAVALNRAGYRTALVGKYPNSYDTRAGKRPGWDTWFAEQGQPRYWASQHQRFLPDARARRGASIARTTSASVPLFLWYADVPPHSDGSKPPAYAPRHRDAFPEVSDARVRDRLRSILAVDDAVAGIAAALGPNRWDRACVAVLSDNGFLLGEHGVEAKAQPYDAAVRVPMLLRCPGIAPGTDNRLVANIDLVPTLARVAGARLSWRSDGRALQDNWSRERILLESWGNKGGAPRFLAVRTIHETYVDFGSGRVLWDRRVDDEATSQLTPDTAEQWAKWLTALRSCVGEECRKADGGG